MASQENAMAALATIFVFLWFVLVVFAVIRFIESRRLKAMNALAANFDIREIESALVVWRAENPEKDFSHPEAQRIIRECIKKMARFKDANPKVDTEENIAKLIKLLK